MYDLVYKGCIDTSVFKRKVIKICRELDVTIDEISFTNVNGGRYLKVLNDKGTRRADIYFRCLSNTILYITKDNRRKSKEYLIEALKEFKIYE